MSWPQTRMGLGGSRMPWPQTRIPFVQSRMGLGGTRIPWHYSRIGLAKIRISLTGSRMHQEGRNRRGPISISFKKFNFNNSASSRGKR